MDCALQYSHSQVEIYCEQADWAHAKDVEGTFRVIPLVRFMTE